MLYIDSTIHHASAIQQAWEGEISTISITDEREVSLDDSMYAPLKGLWTRAMEIIDLLTSW